MEKETFEKVRREGDKMIIGMICEKCKERMHQFEITNLTPSIFDEMVREVVFGHGSDQKCKNRVKLWIVEQKQK